MKILELDLYSTDLKSARLFYGGRLGLPVLVHTPTQLTVLIGYTRLTFHHIDRPVAPYHLAVNVPGSLLDVLMYNYDLEFLPTGSSGQTVACFPDWRAESCYCYDPGGNVLEFIARLDLHLGDSNLTLSDVFQGVSEIGLPTEGVAYTTEALKRRFGVTQFTRTIPVHDFNALGDENGLFILAQQGRNWLFTDTRAELSYCRVRFINQPGDVPKELHSYEVNRLPIGYSTIQRFNDTPVYRYTGNRLKQVPERDDDRTNVMLPVPAVGHQRSFPA